MPQQAKRICRWAWCSNSCFGPYFDQHKEAAKKKSAGKRKEDPDPFYKSWAWRNFRKMILNRDPICKICGRSASREVDHIKPIKQGGDQLDSDNAQGLCKPCHSRKTASEDGGFGNKKLDSKKLR